MSELLPAPSGGRRNVRILLFVIILATAPLYCIGFVLWGVAPGAQPPATLTPALSPRLGTATPTRTSTPFLRVIVTATRPLPPTPRQFQPPAQLPVQQQPLQPVILPTANLSQPLLPAPLQQPVQQPGQQPVVVPSPTPLVTPTVVPVQAGGP